MQPGNVDPGQDPHGQPPQYIDPYTIPQYPPDPSYPEAYPSGGLQPGGYPQQGMPPGPYPEAYQPGGVQPNPYPQQPGYGGYQMPGFGGPVQNNNPGLLAMIFGILSIPLVFCWIGAGFAIASIVLGVIGTQKASKGLASNRGQAITGIACGIFTLLLGIGLIIASVALNAWQP